MAGLRQRSGFDYVAHTDNVDVFILGEHVEGAPYVVLPVAQVAAQADICCRHWLHQEIQILELKTTSYN